MEIESLEGFPKLRDLPGPDVLSPRTIDTRVLILGGGPSGMAAAIELGKIGIDTIVVDDKDRLGGKLVLQTHKFFGSVADCHAGTRGIHIAELLAGEISELESVDTWLNSIVLGVFSDGTVGIRCRDGYRIVRMHITGSIRCRSVPDPCEQGSCKVR
jgi:heterodisulfide reductase subunit A-like polyferredoxin